MRFPATPLLALLLAVPAALTGCGKDNSSLLGPEATATAPTAATTETADNAESRDQAEANHPAWRLPRVQFVHASPDAPGVDIYLGRTKVVRNLGFSSNTGYKRVFPGNRRVRVNATGTDVTVIDASVRLRLGTTYSVFAANRVATIEPLVLEDDLTRPAKGKAHVRFIHLSPDAPAVDVAVTGGPVVFGNKSFKDYTAFTPLPAGEYDLEVRVAGTSTVALPLPGIVLEEGKIYTVFAKGLLSGTGAQALGAGIIVNRGRSRSYDDAEAAPVAEVQ